MDFTFISLAIKVRLETDIRDPLMLFGIKQAFEASFRSVAGCDKKACNGCGSSVCVYHATFARRITSDPSAVRRHQKPSLPFIFSFPLLPALPNRGNHSTIRLVLTGSAIHNVSFYIKALRSLLEGASPRLFTIVEISSEGYDGSRQEISVGKDHELRQVQILSLDDLSQSCRLDIEEATIHLLSPLVILSEGRPLKRLTFSAFFRPLMRRISSLAYYYCGNEMPLDFGWLARESTGVHVSGDATAWTQWSGDTSKGGICGLAGSFTIRGALGEFFPFLVLGQFVHLGKGAPFGFGWYEISPPSGNP